jgi:hypothetical protein
MLRETSDPLLALLARRSHWFGELSNESMMKTDGSEGRRMNEGGEMIEVDRAMSIAANTSFAREKMTSTLLFEERLVHHGESILMLRLLSTARVVLFGMRTYSWTRKS